MARKVTYFIEDDIDGGPADETVVFSIDGQSYEIDLSVANAAAMREAFAPYVGAGRRSGRVVRTSGAAVRGGRPPAPPVKAAPDTTAVREWAREQGIPVNDRGRLSADLIQRYELAHA